MSYPCICCLCGDSCLTEYEKRCGYAKFCKFLSNANGKLIPFNNYVCCECCEIPDDIDVYDENNVEDRIVYFDDASCEYIVGWHDDHIFLRNVDYIEYIITDDCILSKE